MACDNVNNLDTGDLPSQLQRGTSSKRTNAPGELRPTGDNATHPQKAYAVGRQLHWVDTY